SRYRCSPCGFGRELPTPTTQTPTSCCLLGNLLPRYELPSTGDSVETKRYADMLTLALGTVRFETPEAA
ncbi:hypothetical protein KUCAC02_034386, partial [Chaenocephalus aceratus]